MLVVICMLFHEFLTISLLVIDKVDAVAVLLFCSPQGLVGSVLGKLNVVGKG